MVLNLQECKYIYNIYFIFIINFISLRNKSAFYMRKGVKFINLFGGKRRRIEVF